ncbi:MAG: hypothetical protein WDA02_06255 [Saccharofermentanales bacterium]
MVKVKYKHFLLEKLVDGELKYYVYDWDDNILVMNTLIHLDKMVDGEWVPVDVSTAEFREVRKYIDEWVKGESNLWRYRDGDSSKPFSDFRDWGPRGEMAFVEDTIDSIRKNNFGPSWYSFLKTLEDGSIFMVATARGHEPETIRKSIEWIIFNMLNNKQKTNMEKNLRHFNSIFDIDDNDYKFEQLVSNYLDLCDYIGVSSSYFKRRYDMGGQAVNPENGKKVAIKEFVKKVNDYGKYLNKKVKVGFSDDDLSTVQHVYRYMKNELSLNFPIDFYVYHTKDGIKKYVQ